MNVAFLQATIATHVVVDGVPADPWAVTAAIAAIVAAGVAIWTLLITRSELKLAEQQLRETQAATRQAQLSFQLANEQLTFARKADVDRVRAAAPRIIAVLRSRGEHSEWFELVLQNSGGLALYVQLTIGQDNAGQPRNEFVQQVAPGESKIFPNILITKGRAQYLQFVRIRMYDAFGNKYITEYRSLGETQAHPTFREPWLGRGLPEDVAPRPRRWSEEVTWAVEHYERVPGRSDEPVDNDDRESA